MKCFRIFCAVCSVIGALVAAAVPVAAQTSANKPIRIIVPFTPGGSNDVLARAVASKLPELLNIPVIVENKPGAGTNIGADFVAKSVPDGYTLLVAANTTVTLNQHLYAKLPFDPEKDLEPVAMLGSVPFILTVNASHPLTKDIHTISELVDFLKKNPDQLAYGSSGVGGIHHISATLFTTMSGTSMLHVPYRGTAPAVADLLAGEVQVYFAPANSIMPHLRSGKVRALGVTSASRLSFLPQVPAIAEAGYPGYETVSYAVLMAPSKTPLEFVEKLHVAVDHILGDATMKATLAKQYIETNPQSLSSLRKSLRDEAKRWGEVLRQANIRID